MSEAPKCPHCEQPLAEIKQADRSRYYFKWNPETGRYDPDTEHESAEILCFNCGADVYEETEGKINY